MCRYGLQRARRLLVATANRLSAKQWEQRVLFPWGDEGPVAEMLDELLQHELEHVQAIQQWRGSRGWFGLTAGRFPPECRTIAD